MNKRTSDSVYGVYSSLTKAEEPTNDPPESMHGDSGMSPDSRLLHRTWNTIQTFKLPPVFAAWLVLRLACQLTAIMCLTQLQAIHTDWEPQTQDPPQTYCSSALMSAFYKSLVSRV